MWEKRYSEARVNLNKKVLLSYNSDIDHIKFLGDTIWLRNYRGKPKRIRSVRDFFKGLLFSIENGKALELLIEDTRTYEFLKNLSYDEKRLGGQAGIMANLFSLFSDFVVCYPFRLSRELAMLFRENVLFPRNSKLVRAMKAFKKTESERHFVFEFQEGFKAFDFEAPRENRFITSFVNPNLEFSKGFDEMLLSTKFEKAMISGFHLILEKYENGTYRDFLKKVKEHIKILKENETEIHLEFASINSEKMEKAVILEILPMVSSLGLNEVELSSIMKFFKRDSGEDVISVLENLEFLKNRFKLSRIHLHDFGYYLCLEERLNQDSLLSSSLVAASKAYFGEIRQREDLFRAFRFPISHLGLEKLRILGVYLESREFQDTGIFDRGDYFIDFVPTKIVSNPKSTVGLGDTISGIGFLGAE